jgi:hypothetical protein
MDFDSDQESITPHQQPYIKIDTTGALWLPTGTTVQRPGSPSAGYFRYNTDTPGIEYWDGSAWTAPSGGGGGGGPNSFTAVASETLTSGNLVNLWSNGGVASVRRADSTLGYETNGYVTAGFSAAATATVYTEGDITTSGLTVGPVYLSVTGGVSSTIPTAPSLVQQVGFARSSTVYTFQIGTPVQTT